MDKTVLDSEQKRDSSGRYQSKELCEMCAKPITEKAGGWFSDEDTANRGLGLLLCGRKGCCAKRESMSVEERMVAYTAK